MTAWLVLATIFNQTVSNQTVFNHPAACQNIQGEWILGADLARALPAFASMPRDAALGYSPAPGASRVFLYPELKRIATKYGVTLAGDSKVCFEWKVRRVTEEAVRAAIIESLHVPGARVDILAISQAPAPDGKLEFPLSGLSISSGVEPGTPVLWRGHVSYAGSRKFAVWTRVRVTASMTRVVAVESLAPAKPVEKNQVKLETYEGFPLHNDIARDLEEVIGRVPRRAIRARLPVLRADLAEPFQVQRGERVEVTVISGAAQVELEAVAETSGRQGEMITLTNPRSGKPFRARIEGKDRALLLAGRQ